MDLTFVRVKRMLANEKLADGIPRGKPNARNVVIYMAKHGGLQIGFTFFRDVRI